VGTLRGSLGCDSPPKSVSKGAQFWGFLSSWVGSAFGGISSIPPFWTRFGKSRQKQIHIRYMDMSGEDREELQKTVTPQWTFSFPNINAYKYVLNFN
jgi:hypothetical protein